MLQQNEIIDMARQAGFETMLRKGKILGFDRDGDYTEEIETFAKLVADVATAKEREEIAQFIDSTELASLPDALKQHYARMLSFYSSQIRARGQ